MEQTIKLGIIGLGAIGDRLMNILKNIEQIQITALCDIQAELAERTSRQYGDIPWFTEHQVMLQQAELDLVYVAVPPKFHEQIVLDVIAAKKHVFCEKPLANSVEEGVNMLKAARQAGIVHAMHFPLNYQAGLTKFAALIKEGYIGELRQVRLLMHFPHWPRLWQQNNWVGGKEQGGFVLEVGVHWIQALQKIFGRVAKVKSQLLFPQQADACENGIIAQMELEDGTPVLVDGLSQIAGAENIEFAAYGTEGTVLLRNWRQLQAGKKGESLSDIATDDVIPNQMLPEIVKAVQGKEAEIYDFVVGLHAQLVLDALRHPLDSEWKEIDYGKYGL